MANRDTENTPTKLPDGVGGTLLGTSRILRAAQSIMVSSRPVVISSEIAEVVRPFSVNLSKGLYGVTFAYLGVDMALKYSTIYKHPDQHKVMITMADATAKSALINVAIPATGVYGVMSGTQRMFRGINSFGSKGLSIIAGVCALPVIFSGGDRLGNWMVGWFRWGGAYEDILLFKENGDLKEPIPTWSHSSQVPISCPSSVSTKMTREELDLKIAMMMAERDQMD